MRRLRQRGSELEGEMVIAVEEGRRIGTVDEIFLDPVTKRISGLALRARGTGRRCFLDASEIQTLGAEVLLVRSESALERLTEDRPPVGRGLRDLQGVWVTTFDGVHLGRLADVEIRPDDRVITDLRLSDGRLLTVDPPDVTIGVDEILLPPSYANRAVADSRTSTRGVIARLLGLGLIEDVAFTVRRAWRRPTFRSHVASAPAPIKNGGSTSSDRNSRSSSSTPSSNAPWQA